MNHDDMLWPQHSAAPGSGDAIDFGGDYSFMSLVNFDDLSPTAMDTDFSGDLGVQTNGGTHSTAVDTGVARGFSIGDDMVDVHFSDVQRSMEQRAHFVMQQQHDMQPTMSIPPTPSSVDFHGGQPRIAYQHADPKTDVPIERYDAYRDEQTMFTPLVSPAVTPLLDEFSQRLPEYAGGFSPLNSPALEANRHHTHMSNPHVSQASTPTRTTTQMPETAQSSANPTTTATKHRNTHRRKSATSICPPTRVVLGSPHMKPQRKKVPQPLASTPELNSALAQQARISTPLIPRKEKNTFFPSQINTPVQIPSGTASSNDSVSPEPLSEMAPPPPPRTASNTRSPGNSAEIKPIDSIGLPVTPASLMKLPTDVPNTSDVPPIFMGASTYLRRDVSRKPSLQDEQSTPTLAASRTSNVSRQPSPTSTAAATPAKSKKPTPRSKRGSISSSPSLQPRISPSIKPLLPQGLAPDAASASVMLATKSNYQNIVEGNHSQLGLSYPEHLGTSLTSKRTSHKIAEQGRRNRINTALAEIAGLLPQQNGEKFNNDAGTAAQRESASKASTVEMAIEYIKELKERQEHVDGELAETKGELASVRAELSKTKDELKETKSKLIETEKRLEKE